MATHPTRRDEQRVKRCLRYLKGSRSLVLRLSYRADEGEVQLVKTTVDTSRAGSTDRKSTTGYILSRHGFSLLFANKTQASTTLNSAESELTAISEAATRAKLLVNIFQEIGEEAKIKILSDSKVALQFMQRKGPGRIRDLDVRRMWLQEEIQRGNLELEHLHGKANPADLLTKSPPKQRFQKLREMLGVVRPLEEDEEEECNAVHMDIEGEPRCRQCGERLTCFRCGAGGRSTSSWVNSPVQGRQRGAAALRGTDASRQTGQEGDALTGRMPSSSIALSWSACGQAGSAEQQQQAPNVDGPASHRQMEYLRELLSLGSLTEEVQQEIMLQVRTRAQANWVISQCLAGQM